MKKYVFTGARTCLNLALLALVWLGAVVGTDAYAGSTPALPAGLIRTTTFEYGTASTAAAGQPLGFLAAETSEPDSAQECLKTTYFYDKFGNKNSSSSVACATVTAAPGANSAKVARTTTVDYGSNDGRFPRVVTNAWSQSDSNTYDGRFGAVKTFTDPNGLKVGLDYDDFGRKVKETRYSVGGTASTYTTWDYKPCTDSDARCPTTIGAATVKVSLLVLEKGFTANGLPNAPEKRQYFDALDRVVRVQTQGFDGAGSAAPDLVQDTEYNALGQVLSQSNMYALTAGNAVWTRFTYDDLGRVLTETHPEKNGTIPVDALTKYVYSGLSTTVTNAKNQTKITLKNAKGQVASITDHLGNKVLYTYDPQGNLTQTDAAGSITKMSYSVRGLKLSMQDPAMGSWTYGYNAFGQLVTQRDSLNQSSTMDYDALGRLLRRTEPDLLSEWKYDTKFDGSACGTGKGKLCEARSNNGYNRTHSYDNLGRASSTATILDNPSVPATVTETFDPNTGRVATKTWPTGFVANYSFSPLGYLTGVSGSGNGAPQPVSYTVNKMNAQGQVTEYRTGNNVTTVSDYDLQSQRLNAIRATANGQASGNVLNHSYTYDALGNLLTRIDTSPAVGTQESFSYDDLNRLTTASILGGSVSPNTTQVMYDARGNITYKSDVGRYFYDAARPNRMTNVTLETAPGATVAFTGTRALSYAFDDLKTGAQTVGTTTLGNGNLEYTVSHDAVNNRHTVRYESYTSFNMPSQFVYGNFITNTSSTADRTLSFVYGPEHQRTKQNINLTGNGTSAYFAGNVWYLNGEDSLGLSYEKEVRANGTTENKHFVSAAGAVFAVFTSRTGTLNGLPATTTSYLTQDHLSSASVITDETGAVVERLAYDPWGKRRNIMTLPGTPDNLDALVGLKIDRGYTMHEHLDEVGIIHMNGRVFDPLIGRFMSADPLIQAPENLKSFNRYSYVWNNPLKFFDPTGYMTLQSDDQLSSGVGLDYAARNDQYLDNLYSRTAPPADFRINMLLNGRNQGSTSMTLMSPFGSPTGDSITLPAVGVSGGNSVAINFCTTPTITSFYSTSGRDPMGTKSAIYDTGKALWNTGLGFVELVPNLVWGAVPGGSDYNAFLDKYRGNYDTPLFGVGVEILTGVGSFKALASLGTGVQTVNTAEAAANAALAAGKRTGAAAELRVGDRVFTGVSGEVVTPNPQVTGALMSTPPSARAPWHGGCAEGVCLDKALNANVNPAGGTVRAVNIGTSGTGHNTLKPICSSCNDLLRFFGVSQ